MNPPVLTRPAPAAAPAQPRRAPRAPRSRVPLAAAAVLVACLILVTAAFARSRGGHDDSLAEALFWTSTIGGYAAAALVLFRAELRRGERVSVVVLGFLFGFAIKALHDPTMLFASDEFTHLANTQHLLSSGGLTGQSALAGTPVAADYPGLHLVAATLDQVAGLGLHASAVLSIGVARLLVALALFGLFERITGSARTAALAALFYAVNANFVFWSTQFSYESLSLPLFVVLILLLATRATASRPVRRTFTGSALGLAGAIVVTHHVTSYILVGTLWSMCLMSLLPRWRRLRCLDLAVVSTLMAGAWYGLAARATGPYLAFTYHRSVNAVRGTSGGAQHKPFQSASGLPTPPFDRGLAFLAVALLGVGMLVGIIRLRPKLTGDTGSWLLLAGLSGAFLALFPLKLFPGAWEAANRSGDFSAIGAALVLAVGVAWMTRHAGRGRRVAVALAAGATISGAVIQGWPAHVILPQPFAVEAADGETIMPPGMATSQWLLSALPPGSTYVADEATGRELALGGAGLAYAGRTTGAPALLQAPDPSLPAWQRKLLVDTRADYVVLDRRKVSGDNVAGYYFEPAGLPDGLDGYWPALVRTKYGRLPRSRRVLDAGDIVVYDVRGLRQGPAPCAISRLPHDRHESSCISPDGRVLDYAGLTATLPVGGLTYRLLETRVEPGWRHDGLWVTVLVQARNLGRTPLAPAPMQLETGGAMVAPTAHAPDRRDLLSPTKALAPGAHEQGALRFVLHGSAARDFALRTSQWHVVVPRGHEGIFSLTLAPREGSR